MAPDELKYDLMADPFVDDRAAWERGEKRKQLFDRRDGSVYRMDPTLRLAVDVALATGRPLLLRGDPGSGKSSLAPYLARNLKARYLEEVVSATTRVEDFLWRFDTVRKLSDAQARRKDDPELDDRDYVVPGVLWRAFDPDGVFGSGAQPDAVVLIDEIDKADPDVPNGLLVALGSGRFDVPAREAPVTVPDGRRVVVVITTNEERQLPPAFLRRCVVASIPEPTQDSLEEIARLHFAGPGGTPDAKLAERAALLAEKLVTLRKASSGRERPPGIAEYLDAIRACTNLNVEPNDKDPTWSAIENYTLLKPTDVA